MVWVFAVVVGNLAAIRPHGYRRAGGMAIRAQLLFAVFEFGFFDLDDDVGILGMILVGNDNVGFLRLSAKSHGMLEGKARLEIAVLPNKPCCVELADDFFGFELNFLLPNDARDKGRFFAPDGFEADFLFEGIDFLL